MACFEFAPMHLTGQDIDMQKFTDAHINRIETQLELIKQVGIEQYLSEQMHK